MRVRGYGRTIGAAAVALVVLICAAVSLREKFDWVGASPDLTVADVAGTWATSAARVRLEPDGSFRAERLDLCAWHARIFPVGGAGTFALSPPRELHRHQVIELRFAEPSAFTWSGWKVDGSVLTVDVDDGQGWVRNCRFTKV